jgi:hypothetical protein
MPNATGLPPKGQSRWPLGQFGPVNQVGIQKIFDDMVKQGFGPYILTATGPANSAAFSGVFTPMSAIPLTRLNLTGSQFDELNKQQKLKGNIIIWADVFGTPQDTRYTGVWGPNPSRQAWNCDAIDEGGAELQARFEAFNELTEEPRHIAGLYFYQLLDRLVDPAYKVWVDFLKRPHRHQDLGAPSISQCHAQLNAKYGSEINFLAGSRRNEIYLPICGSCGWPLIKRERKFPELEGRSHPAATAFAERVEFNQS